MAHDPEAYDYNAFAFETVDPTDYKTIGRIILEIGAEEGPLVTIAAGDQNHLRFLQEDAIAQLDLRIRPDDDDVYERARRTHDALHAYEAVIHGQT